MDTLKTSNMSRCSYTRFEWIEDFPESIEIPCWKETWSGSEEYCIFHDPSLEKDTKLFERELKEKLAKENYDFIGYYFPEVAYFPYWEFGEDVSFKGATFQEKAHFNGATFQGVDFSGATFQKNAHFRGATFQRDAIFESVTFQRDAIFTVTTFQDANFGRATFQGVDFGDATFHDADFRWATFQEKAYFNGAVFQKNAEFSSATFQRDSNFKGATFQRDAEFSSATFQRDSNFKGAAFQDADFREATFQDADFREATFEKASFRWATFERITEFAPKHIEELDLRNTQFHFRGNITANLKKTLLHRAYLENVAFIDCEWPEIIYEEENMKDKDIDLTFKELETIYRDLKQNMQCHGNYSRAGKFYYREMECRKRAMRKKKLSLNYFRSFGYSLLKYTCGYGEKPERTAFSSAVTILAFAFFYWGLNCLEYPRGNPEFLNGFFHAVYFSFVTFTTLGLGDIHPSNNLGMALICCEAVIGAFLIALFVVVFARKMMR